MSLKSLAPKPIKRAVKSIFRFIRYLQYWGTGRYCPVCNFSSRQFLGHHAINNSEDTICPYCKLLPRHRLLWLFFEKRTTFLDGTPKKMLHVAPEPFLELKLRKIPKLELTTADLMDPYVDAKMDITEIQFPDNYFDVILCSHVLEHVDDDRKAIREFHRVLKPTGFALLLVPINAEVTVEDPTVTDPNERLRLFNQVDHVRKYGPDYVNRLVEAGFKVDVASPEDLVDEGCIARMRLEQHAGFIHFCTKNQPRLDTRQ